MAISQFLDVIAPDAVIDTSWRHADAVARQTSVAPQRDFEEVMFQAGSHTCIVTVRSLVQECTILRFVFQRGLLTDDTAG
jgi:hypothetical protein